MVPKRSGDVRICVDFRRLNESVQRETYPLPKVDNTLAQRSSWIVSLGGASTWRLTTNPWSLSSAQLTWIGCHQEFSASVFVQCASIIRLKLSLGNPFTRPMHCCGHRKHHNQVVKSILTLSIMIHAIVSLLPIASSPIVRFSVMTTFLPSASSSATRSGHTNTK